MQDAFSVGIDIGGTVTKGVLLLGNKIVKKEKIATPQSATELLVALPLFLKTVQGDRTIQKIGIALAAILNSARRELLVAPNVSCLRMDRLQYRLARAVSAAVVLENDANAAAFAEYRLGAGKGLGSLILLTLGTGTGGGIVMKGKLLMGEHGMAGEIGHIIVNPKGPRCICRQRGCLEMYASKKFLIRNGILDPKEAELRARKGKRREKGVYAEMGYWLGIGMVSVANMFDPDAIIVGGGLSAAGALILSPAKAQLNKSPKGLAPRVVSIRRAELGQFSGAIGAALLSQ